MDENKMRAAIREELAAVSVPKVLKTKEVAAILGVTESCLNHWRVKAKKGPTHTVIEGSIRYLLTDVNSYLTSKRVLTQESKDL